jgi:hypothetical protein
VPADLPVTRPYFHRLALSDTRYAVEASSPPHPWSAAPFVAAATYSVEGVRVVIRTPITRREPQLPYGLVTRELAVLPAVAVNVSRGVRVGNGGPPGVGVSVGAALTALWACAVGDPPTASAPTARTISQMATSAQDSSARLWRDMRSALPCLMRFPSGGSGSSCFYWLTTGLV